MYLISLTSGAVVNLIINYLLIPRYQGIGAIIGTIAAEFSVAFIQFFMLRREIDLKKYLINGSFFCIIGLIMYGVVHWLADFSSSAVITIAVQIICGAIIYIILSFLYMIATKQIILVNEGLKILKIKYRFK